MVSMQEEPLMLQTVISSQKGAPVSHLGELLARQCLCLTLRAAASHAVRQGKRLVKRVLQVLASRNGIRAVEER
jgi:hypothetical protein